MEKGLRQTSYDWAELAKCKGMDLDIFFPPDDATNKQAYEVCAQCLVSAACLDYAIANRIFDGVWGGKSERERRRIIKQLKT